MEYEIKLIYVVSQKQNEEEKEYVNTKIIHVLLDLSCKLLGRTVGYSLRVRLFI